MSTQVRAAQKLKDGEELQQRATEVLTMLKTGTL
jgi:hypothetical protein